MQTSINMCFEQITNLNLLQSRMLVIAKLLWMVLMMVVVIEVMVNVVVALVARPYGQCLQRQVQKFHYECTHHVHRH